MTHSVLRTAIRRMSWPVGPGHTAVAHGASALWGWTRGGARTLARRLRGNTSLPDVDRRVMHFGTLHIAVGKHHLFTAEDFRLAFPGLSILSGPNGCGKTTFLRQCARLCVRRQFASRQQIGYISPLSAYDRSIPLTGQTFVQLYAGKSAWAPGLHSHFAHLKPKSIRDMSSGEFQALLLVAHLSSPKDLLFFDEPFSHLNPAWTRIFVASLDERARASTILVICHHLEEFYDLPAHHLTITHGRLEAP